MTTRRRARAAGAAAQTAAQTDGSQSAAGAQHGALPIITHQQADLPLLPYIKNPASLKKISPTKLTSLNFHE